MYTIVIRSDPRHPYTGSAWDKARARHLYKPYYESRDEATKIIERLRLYTHSLEIKHFPIPPANRRG